MDLTWFYFICFLSATVLWKDHNGTLEESLNRFEERIGIRTELPSDSTENVPPPYYINPREEKVDSTWILPDRLKIKETKNDSTRNT